MHNRKLSSEGKKSLITATFSTYIMNHQFFVLLQWKRVPELRILKKLNIVCD